MTPLPPFLGSALAILWLPAAAASALDPTHAVVVAPAGLSRLEQKAVSLLVEEVENRSQIRWEVRADNARYGAATLALGQAGALQGITVLKLEMAENRAEEGFPLQGKPGCPGSIRKRCRQRSSWCALRHRLPVAAASSHARLDYGGEPHTVGFITYSEGCNDDVNKIAWSALGWNPDIEATDVFRVFSSYFIGENYTENLAQGLLALERNWRGPLIANGGVDTTLLQFQQMEREATPRVKANWRFQEALFRANYAAYRRSRLIHETALEDRAMDKVRESGRLSARIAMDDAEAILNRAVTELVSRLGARVRSNWAMRCSRVSACN